MLGQMPQSKWTQIMEWFRFATRLPIIALLIVAAAMFSWLGFWLIVRFSIFLYSRYLDQPW